MSKSISAVIKFSFILILLLESSLLLSSCQPEEPSLSPEAGKALELWLDGNPPTPGALVKKAIGKGQTVIFAQDEILRADSIETMQALLPVVYDAGVRSTGIFFLEASKQEEIDTFIMGSPETYNIPENQIPALKLLFASDASLGYAEYCDFITYVSDFNRALKPGLSPMRLMGLGEKGTLSPEALNSVLGVKKSIESSDSDSTTTSSTGEATEEALTPDADQENLISGEIFLEDIFLWVKTGDLEILPEIPEESAFAIVKHHGPVAGVTPLNGLIESVVSARDIRDRSFSYSPEEVEFDNENSADIIIVSSFPYHSVSPIEDFITAENVADAAHFFPETGLENLPGWKARRMNRQISRAAKRYEKNLKYIR